MQLGFFVVRLEVLVSCSQNWDNFSDSVDPAGLVRSHLSCLSWASASALAPKYWWKCIGTDRRPRRLLWHDAGAVRSRGGMPQWVAPLTPASAGLEPSLAQEKSLQNRLRHIKSITFISPTPCLLQGFKQSNGPWFLHSIFAYKDELRVLLSFLGSQGGTYITFLCITVLGAFMKIKHYPHL